MDIYKFGSGKSYVHYPEEYEKPSRKIKKTGPEYMFNPDDRVRSRDKKRSTLMRASREKSESPYPLFMQKTGIR